MVLFKVRKAGREDRGVRMAQGRHVSRDPRGPVLDRRHALAALWALGAAGLALAAGCVGEGGPGGQGGATPAADDGEQGATVSGCVAHQAAVCDGELVYYVDFSEGSLARCAPDGGERTVLYTNGQVNHLGIRYLLCTQGEVLFCDAPTASLRAVDTRGGEARTLWASESAAVLPLPVCASGGRIWVSLLDSTDRSSRVASVALDGSDAQTHLALPAGFFPQLVDASATRVYYAGVSPDDVRQVRSDALGGSDERVLFSLDGVPSASSAISWQVAGGRLLVEAQDDTKASNRLLSLALDGTDEQQVYDFSSQKMLYDQAGSSMFFLNRETFSLMARRAAGGPMVEELAQIPRRDTSTAVALLEAGDGMAWVTTVTAGQDSANEYVTYHVDQQTGQVTELS